MGLSDELKESSARTPALILAVLVLLGIGLAAVAALQGDPDPITSQVVRASPRATTTTSSTVAVDTSTTTTPTAAVPTVTQAPGAPPVVPTVVPTTAGPAPVQTTAAPPPPPPPSTQCTPSQADQTLTTDKATYAAGEIVTVTATVRNHSATSCTLANPDTGCYSLFAAIMGADTNNPYWRSGSVATGSCSPPPRRTLLPGQVATFTASWDQSDRRGCRADNSDPGCSKPRVPGLYTIQSLWLGQAKGTVLTLS